MDMKTKNQLTKTPFLLLVMLLCVSVVGCTGQGRRHKYTLTECELPNAEWQLDLSFPDWKEEVNSSVAINNRTGFYAYRGQGSLYLRCEEPCKSFSLYINNEKLDTSKVVPGKTFQVDISDLTVSGQNSLQLSDIEAGTVRVCIPYPEVLDGTIKEAGISKNAIGLIEDIITADIEHGFSSAQLAIVKEGKLVYANAWGNVQTYDENGNPVESTPVTNETLYDLASNTKMYSVNYAVQYLQTRGEIDLDTKIVDILGSGFAKDTIEIAYDGYEKVSLKDNKKWKSELTLRNLLKHQGGLPPAPQYFNNHWDNGTFDFNSPKENILYVGTAGDEATREATLKEIFRTPLMYEPGSETVYSDLDYIVLCYCLEKITGKRLDDFLKETFYEPMGLSHITYNPLQNGFKKEDCAATELMGNSRDGQVVYDGARLYTLQGEVHDPLAYYCMAGVSGHAGLFSNATDLAKLASVMLTGGYGDLRFFSRDVIEAYTAPKSEEDTNYGLGWWRQSEHQRDRYFGTLSSPATFGHQGFTGTLTMIDPEEQMVIVLLTNKIHSRILEGDETLNQYKGNFYTTATLGFVPEIVEISLHSTQDEKDLLKSLLFDMTADIEREIKEQEITDPNHPLVRAKEALKTVGEEKLHEADN